MYFVTTMDWNDGKENGKLSGSGTLDKAKVMIAGGTARQSDSMFSFKIIFENEDTRRASTLPKEGEPIPAELLPKSYDVTCKAIVKT